MVQPLASLLLTHPSPHHISLSNPSITFSLPANPLSHSHNTKHSSLTLTPDLLQATLSHSN